MATTLAIGSTLASWAVQAGGLALVANDSTESLGVGIFLGGAALSAVAPSAGHFYAGEVKHAVLFSAIRGAGLTLFGLGAVSSAASSTVCDGCDDTAGTVMMAVGITTAAGLGIYDWATAGDAADAHNRAAAKPRGIAFSVVPAVSPRSTGLAVAGAF